MKTKELLSLPVGKYICVDEICNYKYVLTVIESRVVDGIELNRFGIREYGTSIFSPCISFDRDWIRSFDKSYGKTWQGMSHIGGIITRSDDMSIMVNNLSIVCRLEESEELYKHLKNFVIERVCNLPNSNYQKKFLQDKLKQLRNETI